MTKILIAYPMEEKFRRIVEEILPKDIIIYYEDMDKKSLEDVEIVLVRSWRIARDIIHKLPKLKYIQYLFAGVDRIKTEEIPKGVVLLSNSGANARGVAEHALSLLLTAAKKITWRDREMRIGNFPQTSESLLLTNKIAVILGTGNIGREIAKMLRCLSVKVIGVNKSGRNPDNLFHEIYTIDKLKKVLAIADFCIIALPLTPETENLIDEEKLSVMKKNAILVNVGRGKIINERALYNHLRKNKSFIAALDVWWKYPKQGEKFQQNCDFASLDNVIMSPHCAGVYENYEIDLLKHALENIKLILLGKMPRNIILG